MVKNKIKFINLLLMLSFSLFISSCSSDISTLTNSDPTPVDITLDGEWESGGLSYFINQECSGDGFTLGQFSNMTLQSNYEIQLEFMVAALCSASDNYLGWADLPQCIEEQSAALYEEDYSDSLSFQSKISYNYNFSNLILTLMVGSGDTPNSYIISYDGECEQTEGYTGNTIEDEGSCLFYDSNGNPISEWTGTECIFITQTSCEGLANGTWDGYITGVWYESGENYVLENFFSDDNKILVFDGTSLSILVDSNVDQCICGDDAVTVDLSNEDEYPNPEQSCVTNTQMDCIWLDNYCVSLNFNK